MVALTTTTEDLNAMLAEVEEALKEREEDVELRREKNDEYNNLKKEVDEQLTKMETGNSGKEDGFGEKKTTTIECVSFFPFRLE